MSLQVLSHSESKLLDFLLKHNALNKSKVKDYSKEH